VITRGERRSVVRRRRYDLDFVAVMGKNHKTSIGKFLKEVLSRREPRQASSTGGVIIHVTTINENARNLVDMVVPWIHSDAE